MSLIKELVDLVTQLNNSISDGKVRQKTLPIQELAIKIQQSQLNLERERLEEVTRLHGAILELQTEVSRLKSLQPQIPDHAITPRPLDPCPFCRLNAGVLENLFPDHTFGHLGKINAHFKCSNPECNRTYQKKHKE